LTVTADGSNENGYTNDRTPEFRGIAEANSLVTLRNGEAVLGTATADGTGLWTVTSSSLPSDGAYTVTLAASDAAGNTSSATSLSFTLDTAAPAAPTVTSFAFDTGASNSDRITSDANPTFAGTAEANSLVTLRNVGNVLGTATVDGAGLWTVTSSNLTDGAYTVTVTATDAAGNTGSATSSSFTLDTQDPQASTVGLALGDQGGTADVTGAVRPSLVGFAEAGTEVRVSLGDELLTAPFTSTGAWTVTLTDELTAGAYTATVEVKDLAGNEAENATFTFTAVQELPDPTDEEPVLNDDVLTIQSDAEEMTIVIGGRTYTGERNDGGFEFDFSDTTVTPGQETTYFTVEVDEANNVIFGAPRTTTLIDDIIPGFRLVEDTSGADGSVDLASLTLDYTGLTFLADAPVDGLPAAPALQDVLTSDAAIDLSAYATAEDVGLDGSVNMAGAATPERLVTLPSADFGFGMDGMLIPENPFHLHGAVAW
jgi:hypothetical protein